MIPATISCVTDWSNICSAWQCAFSTAFFYGDVEKAQIEKLQQFAEMLFQSYKDEGASLLVFPIRDCDWKNKPNLSADCLYI